MSRYGRASQALRSGIRPIRCDCFGAALAPGRRRQHWRVSRQHALRRRAGAVDRVAGPFLGSRGLAADHVRLRSGGGQAPAGAPLIVRPLRADSSLHPSHLVHRRTVMLRCAEREAARCRARLPLAAVGVAPRLGFESPALAGGGCWQKSLAGVPCTYEWQSRPGSLPGRSSRPARWRAVAVLSAVSSAKAGRRTGHRSLAIP